MLFPLGRVVATPGALELLQEMYGEDIAEVSAAELINRHHTGDWGDLEKSDKRLNDAAVKDGSRILSAYVVHNRKFWIITEADRSSTTILLPEEY